MYAQSDQPAPLVHDTAAAGYGSLINALDVPDHKRWLGLSHVKLNDIEAVLPESPAFTKEVTASATKNSQYTIRSVSKQAVGVRLLIFTKKGGESPVETRELTVPGRGETSGKISSAWTRLEFRAGSKDQVQVVFIPATN